MVVSTPALRVGFGGFLSWWFTELGSLIPRNLLRVLVPSEKFIFVRLGDDSITISKIENGKSTRIDEFFISGDDAELARQKFRKITRSFAPASWRWGVALDENLVLRDLLWLPAAATENLYETLEFQINRQTPFERDQVCFDCRIAKGGASTGSVAVEYVVVQRDIIERTLQRARDFGIPVQFVTATDEQAPRDLPFNLLPKEYRPKRRRFFRYNLVLAFAALLLGGLAIYLPMDQERRTVNALSARVDQLRADANVSLALRKKIEIERREINALVSLKREKTMLTQALDDLTRLLPDNAWVSRFTYRDGTLKAVVHAPETVAIVRLIEESTVFSNAKIVTAVRRDAQTGQERFTISFDAPGRKQF
jgi:general secretion pathway protein L